MGFFPHSISGDTLFQICQLQHQLSRIQAKMNARKTFQRLTFQIYKQYQKSNILQQSQYRTLMQSIHIPVLTPIICETPLDLQTIRALGSFTLSPLETDSYLSLALTDKNLLYFQNPKTMSPSHICPLNFDLKFQVVRQTPWKDELTPGKPIGIKFEKELPNKTFEILLIYSNDSSLIYTWKHFLESKINQRSFHTLFKAKKQIGKGAFATVYLAERLQDKKLVAVKAFSKQRQYSGQQGKQSLANQINLMRKINHPNVMRLQGVYETDNSIYVILQILEGRQLYDRLKNNEIKNQKDVTEIIKNILSALKSLAQKRVIHRDLKPENIMFRKQGSNDLAICDFGLATHADEEKYLFVRCGTPGFVAPQIINIRDMSTKSDPISDVFSAGLIFHYLLFGRSIFQGKKYQQILTQNRACTFNFQKDMYKVADGIAIDLMKRLLDVNPRTRMSAAEALHHPYFDFNRLQPKIVFPRNECSQMVDQKQEDLTTIVGRAKRVPTKLSESGNFQNQGSQNNKFRRNSYRGSIYCQKQNGYQLTLTKKISLDIQLEGPVRRSKRTSAQQRKVHYHPMRY